MSADYSLLLIGYGLVWLAGLARSLVNEQLYPQAAHNADRLLFAAIAIFSIWVCGFRDISTGTDTPGYIRYYNLIAGDPDFDPARFPAVEFLFYGYIKAVHAVWDSERLYLLLAHLLFLVPFLLFLRHVGGSRKGLLYLVYVSCFFYYSLNLNVIRSAIAAGLTLLGIWYFNQKNSFAGCLLLLLALQFHVSVALVAVGGLVAWPLRAQPAKIWYGLALTVGLQQAGFSPITLASGIGLDAVTRISNKISSYSNAGIAYTTGFRLDFALFNLLFFFIGTRFIRRGQTDDFYSLVVTLYGVLTCLFIFSFGIPYNDRIGLWSWLFIPIIIAYPALNAGRPTQLSLTLTALGLGIISLYMIRIQFPH
jgi:hypothetical protein